MRAGLRGIGLLLVIATAASTADPVVEELFKQTSEKVLENARRLPRYTCIETISRTQYKPARTAASCQSLMALRKLAPSRGPLSFRDRLRLDVAVVDNSEIFSWAGAGKFETNDVADLVGNGASGSGEFGGFLSSVFSGAPDSIQFVGRRDSAALFQFNVPLSRSTYQLQTTLKQDRRVMPYHGTFSVDPADGDLEQLLVETDQFEPGDEVCHVQHVMNYSRVKIGKDDFVLPDVSTMEALYRNGAESVNETHYSGCREYVGESTIRFDDPDTPAADNATAKVNLQPLPPKVRLSIGLMTPITTEASAAGDEVEGVLLKDAVEKKQVIARAGARMHGRILRLQQIADALPRWVIAIRFDTIERGGNSQAISLQALDEGIRAGPPGKRPNLVNTAEKPSGSGLFIFMGAGNFVLGRNFHSEWETR
jgi:hypothetical protein